MSGHKRLEGGNVGKLATTRDRPTHDLLYTSPRFVRSICQIGDRIELGYQLKIRWHSLSLLEAVSSQKLTMRQNWLLTGCRLGLVVLWAI
ncbi:hypothetical protein [Chamaesiphon sp. VAR_69_metabat_338]|uniref:hypothetical protein n=1 Tax=Chamaesiphon sp. VAR_69_metabat_338 TaxID=2964704 RepID=UPI00286E8A71|nr:hypothetical protein [Chamaesiphon sp. VAR_69_metabat_338]